MWLHRASTSECGGSVQAAIEKTVPYPATPIHWQLQKIARITSSTRLTARFAPPASGLPEGASRRDFELRGYVDNAILLHRHRACLDAQKYQMQVSKVKLNA